MKNQNTSKLIGSLIYVAIGLVLIVYPSIVGETVCYMISGAAVAMGVIEIIAYSMVTVESRVTEDSNGLAEGIILILLGVFILIKKDFVIELIPLILGFMITVKGIKGIQTAFNLKRIGYGNFKLNVGISLAVGIFGLIMMLDPFGTAKVLFIMIGIGLFLSGIIDIATSFILDRQIKKAKKAAQMDSM